MGEIPDPHLLLVKDLVFFVVGDEVVLDEFVVDDGGLDGFGIPLDLGFELELVTDVRLHNLKILIQK